MLDAKTASPSSSVLVKDKFKDEEKESTKDTTSDCTIVWDGKTASPSSSVLVKDKIKYTGEIDLVTKDRNAEADINEYFNSGIRSEGAVERNENDDKGDT